MNGKDKKFIELDIEKCFYQINHQKILDKEIAQQWIKNYLWQCLKAAVDAKYLSWSRNSSSVKPIVNQHSFKRNWKYPNINKIYQ